MRSAFDKQLKSLNENLTTMGAMCEEIIALAAKSITDKDIALAERIPQLASEIDQMERHIEASCLKLLLQQQPVARDLRQISAALKMVTDMERIGNQALNIAELIKFIQDKKDIDMEYLRNMADAAIKMVTDSIDAYVISDVNLVRQVIKYDDIVDAYFVKIKNQLITMIRENNVDAEYVLDMLMIAKYLERIGDHASNIAAWVEFSVTGIHKGVDHK